MPRNLSFPELLQILNSVFAFGTDERGLTLLVDLPDDRVPDTSAWRDRTRIATEWFTILQGHITDIPIASLNFCAYPNVGSNNNDLPHTMTLVDSCTRAVPMVASQAVPLRSILEMSSIVLAMTELSATAPLKLLAPSYGFRGATLPGFSRTMIPALRLDYTKVHARVVELKTRMDRAERARLVLRARGTEYETSLDLRFRAGHASGGLIRERGSVANLPSGEAYIVPYEGEREGIPSLSAGTLPVQIDREIVLFQIQYNRVVDVLSEGPESASQRIKLLSEPAYGNIAELGLGVLGEWGIKAVGSTLLDEKLGLHVAFGRSDHFGGVTAPSNFRNAANVIHLDWVFSPEIQPEIEVCCVEFTYPNGAHEEVMKNNAFVI